MDEIFVIVQGGIVQDIYGSPSLKNCNVTVIDEDVQDEDEAAVVCGMVDKCYDRVITGELERLY